MHDYDEDRRTEQCVYAALNLKQHLWSTYCSEAYDRLEASRGLSATAEILYGDLTIFKMADVHHLEFYGFNNGVFEKHM